jgi:FkbM family methyltransferase
MLEDVDTEFFWWFDDDSYVLAPEALPERLRVARGSPSHHVMWGHVFFCQESDFNHGTDVAGYVKRAPWYRGLEPPSWEPGGKGETDFQGQGTGDGRWFFALGGCWFIRTHVLRDLDWPTRGLIKRADDVLLGEAIRQQGWVCHDIGPLGIQLDHQQPRRGEGEDKATMERQMGGVADGPAAAIRYAGANLLQWRVAHEMTVWCLDGELIVSDTGAHSYHLLRVEDARFLYRRVRLRCLLRPLAGATANFYVHHYGDIDLAEIALDGTILNRGTCLDLTVERDPDDRLLVDLEYLSCHSTVSIGCSRDGHRVYAGDGGEQFAIVFIEVEALDAAAELSRIADEERITLIDVGAQAGLQLKWMLKADRITPVLFEPLPAEAEALRRTIGRIPGGQVVEQALADTTGSRTLYVTADSSCSSLHEPNHELLRGYTVAPLFETIRQMPVACTRYDDLFQRHLVPRPDVIKIDVQGFEYEVLQGFGELLQSCIGVELEAHFYPIYKGQKLIGEIVDLLAGRGFVLREIRPVHHFDGDLAEVEAFFTKRRDDVRRFPAAQLKKFTLLTEVWGLSPYV